MKKLDEGLVSVLAAGGEADAVVRVRNPWQLGYIARHFKVAAMFPFISALGLRCDRKDAVRLAEMHEVVSVSASGRVSALDALDTRGGGAAGKTAANDGEAKQGASDASEGGRSADVGTSSAAANAEAEIFSAKGLTGRGVTLCVLDTGVSPHSDISIPRDRVKEFRDFVGGKEFPYDDNGHGTFVTGVAAGNGILSAGEVHGVAPQADVVSVKVISASGETGAFTILEGMQWLYDNFRRLNVKVACMSFGADPLASADPLKLGAEMLARSGITVVCAAGNSGVGGLKSPGVSGEVITVGAVDENLKVAPFSSSGVYQGVYRPDVYAPGVAVRGVDAGGTYAMMSGTSVSAPYVAGACCLLHERYSALTPRDAKRIIVASSRVVDGVRVFRL